MPELTARHYRTGQVYRVAWEGRRLTRVAPVDGGEAVPAAVLAPSLLDIQVNGYGGLDFSRPEHLAQIAERLAAHGVARFCPTVVTGPPAAMAEALSAIARALDADPHLEAAVPGIHLEGPYISSLDGPRGAHPLAHVRDPDWGHFQHLQAAARGRIRIVTLAPELPGAAQWIERAAAAGVVVAIGHTAAGAEEIRRAIAAGARLSTHLGNGLAATIDRHRNPLWPQLAARELHASFIADGEHLPPEALVAMVAAKGVARSILVSDAVPQAGLPPGRYRGVGGQEVLVRPSGRIELAGTPYLAGSGAHLARCVAWSAGVGAAGLADAVDMASLHPARLLGLPASAEPAADGYLTVFRPRPDGPDLEVLLTVRAGEVAFHAGG